MDTRRRLIPLFAALSILPAACANAPPPMLVSTVRVDRPQLVAARPTIVLTSTSPPRLLGTCARHAHKAGRHRSSCLVLRMNELASVKRDHRDSGGRRLPSSMPTVVVASATPSQAPKPILIPVMAPAAIPPKSVRVAALVKQPPAAATFVQEAPHDRMDGAIKVFAYAPGRVFPVSAAPLRVTTLTLEPGEVLIDKAAGDTVRWEIGDTTSGSGVGALTLVMLKPLTVGLATNMVLTTSRRVYLLDLTSTGRKADTAIAWSYVAPAPATSFAQLKPPPAPPTPDPVVLGVVSARYRIEPFGRRPAWTPQAVFDDGRRTFIAFGPDLISHTAPLLFVDGADGRPQIVNYRQAGDLYVVDGLFSRMELRLGDGHAEVVRLSRLQSGAGA